MIAKLSPSLYFVFNGTRSRAPRGVPTALRALLGNRECAECWSSFWGGVSHSVR